MSDPTRPPSDELDELASAYLDGEVTPDERARVEADPDLRARVGELGAVRAALAAPPDPADAAARDRALAAAHAEAVASGSTAAVVPIGRHRRSRRGLAVVGAVAAAVIAIVLVAVVTTRPSDHSPNTASLSTGARDVSGGGAATTASASTSFEAATASPTSAASGATTTTGATSAAAAPASGEPPYLGAASDEPGLRALLNAGAASGASAPAVAPIPVPSGCTVPSATLAGTLTWQGTPALVFVGDGRATVVAGSDCRTLVVLPVA
ncbi:MAG TPA: zf-HC2 domain-containing protein [Acidimicrobiales bacterium]|nr:zf-HC2 domain-containing protein [Acidimicrobiales bacterium]